MMISLRRYAFKNIFRNLFRSTGVFLSALLVAACVLAATVTVQGALDSLDAGLGRLGADILVAPWGTNVIRSQVKEVRLIGIPTALWMPAEYATRIAALPGVEHAATQRYLTTLQQPSFSQEPFVYLVAFDPVNDFTILPWLEGEAQPTLEMGEMLAGSRAGLAAGETVELFGYPLKVAGRLEPTGNSVDSSLFISYVTMLDMAQRSSLQAESGLEILPDRVSAILVKVERDASALDVFMSVIRAAPRVKPFKTTEMLQAERQEMLALQRSQWALLGLICLLAILFTGVLFSLLVNERRRELAVLQALGAQRGFIFRALLLEGVFLAVSGGVAGLGVAGLVLALFPAQIAAWTGAGYALPQPGMLLAIGLASLVLALLSVFLGSLLPAWRAMRGEVSMVMRE